MKSLLNLVIDAGNTRIKVASFFQTELIDKKLFDCLEDAHDFLRHASCENVIVSSVSNDVREITAGVTAKNKKLVASIDLSLPVSIAYKTPQTLGIDRIAAACGAHGIFPFHNCLVIDAGTCINYEFIDQTATYHGGAISPGIHMRYKAMHTFTKRLPLVEAVNNINLTGSSTETCLQSGVMHGVWAEVNGIIDQYKEKYPDMKVILCGGDSVFFENKLKHSIFAAPDLVLGGLNRILLQNV